MTFNPASRKAIALLALVFILGVAIGALGLTLMNGRVYGARTNRPAASRQQGAPGSRVVNRLTHDLDLTADQQKRLSEILANTQARYNAIRQQMNPQFDQARAEGREQIRQIMTPEQQTKLDEFYRQVDEEHRRKASDKAR
jgi:Spy/CpxP family protein refolding chaperone